MHLLRTHELLGGETPHKLDPMHVYRSPCIPLVSAKHTHTHTHTLRPILHLFDRPRPGPDALSLPRCALSGHPLADALLS